MSHINLIFFSFFVLLTTILNSKSVLSKPLNIEDKAKELEVDKEIIENSPVWQEWLQSPPVVLDKIRNKPSFTPRIKFGYTQFPSTHHQGGITVGIEDLFIGKTPLTFNADYSGSFQGDRVSVGTDLHYYLFPLGGYVNLAPVIGYRYLETQGYHTDGINLGLRLGLILSPGGAGDIFVTQSFVSPTGSHEVGITEINAGYAITENIRISTEFEWQNSRQKGDSQIGIGLEWIIRQ